MKAPDFAYVCADSVEGARETAAGLRGAGHDVVLIANAPVAGAHIVT